MAIVQNVKTLAALQLQNSMFRRNLNLSTEKKKSTDAFIAMLSTREHFQLSDFSVNFPTLKQTVIFLFINEIIGSITVCPGS